MSRFPIPLAFRTLGSASASRFLPGRGELIWQKKTRQAGENRDPLQLARQEVAVSIGLPGRNHDIDGGQQFVPA